MTFDEALEKFKTDEAYRLAMTVQIMTKLENEVGLYEVEKHLVRKALKCAFPKPHWVQDPEMIWGTEYGKCVCGEVVNDTQSFCPDCGTELKWYQPKKED